MHVSYVKSYGFEQLFSILYAYRYALFFHVSIVYFLILDIFLFCVFSLYFLIFYFFNFNILKSFLLLIVFYINIYTI